MVDRLEKIGVKPNAIGLYDFEILIVRGEKRKVWHTEGDPKKPGNVRFCVPNA